LLEFVFYIWSADFDQPGGMICFLSPHDHVPGFDFAAYRELGSKSAKCENGHVIMRTEDVRAPYYWLLVIMIN
jgi:hypothetical protein